MKELDIHSLWMIILVDPIRLGFFSFWMVFGPSEVIDHSSFEWRDQELRGRDLKDLIFYEVHTGTFISEGTFYSANTQIKDLADLESIEHAIYNTIYRI